MSRITAACLWAALALVALASSPIFSPLPVLAASGTLHTDASLQEAPQDGAVAITFLLAGTVVSLDGPPVDGYYPATVDGLSGWVHGDTLVLDEVEDAPADPGQGVAVDPAMGGSEVAVAEAPAAEPSAATPETVAAAPESTEVAVTAPEPEPAIVAGEPTLTPNAPSVSVPDPGPVGPAGVTADVPIFAGPGPDFGVLGMAAAGAMVEQTGHAVSGYVTVRYVEVTGWVPLDHLGPPPSAVAESASGEPAAAAS